jgi:hypothetical protein
MITRDIKCSAVVLALHPCFPSAADRRHSEPVMQIIERDAYQQALGRGRKRSRLILDRKHKPYDQPIAALTHLPD